ncbi:MAG: A/G-specific adenine glycosylase [Bacteroidales bacterium]
MHFAKTIIEWYNEHKRELPWRNTSEPYPIWVSEVILQQTRVVQGLDYYHRFLRRFPTLAHLAAAPLDEVMIVWQGLGYYTRARNMHLAAKQIISEFNGEFPNTYEGLRSLKGIGDYTASAIGAFAFGIPRPAVDGNVHRVIARVFGIFTPVNTSSGQKQIYATALSHLDTRKPGLFNQAIMEFGATLCTPQKTMCVLCPIQKDCYAYKNDMVNSLPIKEKKTKIRRRYFSYLIPLYKRDTFIQQRVLKDIWHSLYEFPYIETTKNTTLKNLQENDEWKTLFARQSIEILYTSPLIKHTLSHQELHIIFYIIKVREVSIALNNYKLIPSIQLSKYPMPRVITAFLESLNVSSFKYLSIESN